MTQPGPRSELLWVAIDLDNTLAEGIWTPANPTSQIGDVLPEGRRKAREVASQGYKIIINTSRPWTDYEAIEWWLGENGIPFKLIQCGKILASLYVDDRGRHSEADSWLPTAAPSELAFRGALRVTKMATEENTLLRELVQLKDDGPYLEGMRQLDRIHQLHKELRI